MEEWKNGTPIAIGGKNVAIRRFGNERLEECKIVVKPTRFAKPVRFS